MWESKKYENKVNESTKLQPKRIFQIKLKRNIWDTKKYTSLSNDETFKS